MYERIKAAIQQAGVPCYDPGTHVGEVKAAYAVAHDMGTTPKEGTRGMLGTHLYEIVCLVPYKEQAQLPGLVDKVKGALSALSPLRWSGEAAPTGLENTYQGAAQSLIFYYPQRLK